MKRQNETGSLEIRLYVMFIAMAAVILLCSLGLTLLLDISRERQDLDRRISDSAAYIASMGAVSEMLVTGYPNAETRKQLDTFVDSSSSVDSLIIANANGLRFYQTSRRKAGDTYVNGDEAAVLNGSAPYITTVYGTRDSQHTAFHSVTDDSGKILGFVAVSVAASRISQQQRSIISVFFLMFLVMIIFSAALAGAFLRSQSRALMGYRPGELLRMYIRQDEIINAIHEGLISADKSGKILFSNLPARRIVEGSADGEDELLVGRLLKEVFPQTRFDQVIESGEAANNQVCVIRNQTVLVNEVPVRSKRHQLQGVLVILQDRTEALRLSDELSGARNMMDTLRAFNHEFLNKLHIILGYLQTGEIDRAKQFIINSSLVSSQAVREAADALRVSEVCALVIGKMMHAAELGIRLTLLPGSTMLERDLIMQPEEYVTVIGNLLENAIEELHGGNCEIREITLGIYCRPDASIVACEDTGRGIPEELKDRIFEKGVSGKGKNRGTGLYLVKQTAERYHGEIGIETEAGEGTCFTVTVTEQKKEEEGDVSGNDHRG